MTTFYTPEHEWFSIDGEIATVGITDFAQDQLGDLVFIELPGVDTALARGDEAATIESVKAAGDIKSPLAGTVVEVNEALADEPSLVNEDPVGAGWFFRIRVSEAPDTSQYMDEAAYRAYLDDA